MARAVRDARLETRTARSRLAARHEPYWRLISEGVHLGYRKGKRGGVWLARCRPAGGRYRKARLGAADDAAEADGSEVLDFRQAQDTARAWADRQLRGEPAAPAVAGPYTVADAMRDYLADCAHRGVKSLDDARIRSESLILPKLGALEVAALTPARLREWHRELAAAPPRLRTRPGAAQQYRDTEGDPEAERRRRSTANRNLATLKAALNFAYREGKVASDDAWRRVRPFAETAAARTRYLDADEVTRLVNAAEPGLRELVQGALHTGARYGELARMTVADFNADAGTVAVRASKSGRPRHVVLTDEGRTFFEAVTAGRQGDERLFRRRDGSAWGRAHQQRPLAAACARAGIRPAANFYVLRHTYASHLAMRGVPLQVLAANLGHADTRMVEKHYAHLAPSYMAQAIRGAGLGYTVPAHQSNVEALHPRGR